MACGPIRAPSFRTRRELDRARDIAGNRAGNRAIRLEKIWMPRSKGRALDVDVPATALLPSSPFGGLGWESWVQ